MSQTSPIIPAKAGQTKSFPAATQRRGATRTSEVVHSATAFGMSLEDDITFLEQAPVLAALGKQALRVLAIGADTRLLANGAVLHYAGEIADGAYLVREGTLLMEPGTFSDGREYIVKPGTLIWELALIKEMAVPATAIAKEPTVVIRLSRGLFRKMLEGYPDAAEKLRDIFAKRVHGWMRDLGAVRRKLHKE